MTDLPLLDPPATRSQRRFMVIEQLVRRGITDPRVLDAMGRIPREAFVHPTLAVGAYGDHPLPIGHGQTISQPYMVAVMSERLGLHGGEKVLEIGTGSGYGAAVLGLLAGRVVSVERVAPLLEEARERWTALGLENIRGVLGDGSLGYAQEAPYDAIVVTAASPQVPPSLVHQLKPETGRLVIPVGDRSLQFLCIVHRDRWGITRVERDFACVFVPLVGEEGWRLE